jgi:hypothetical protein
MISEVEYVEKMLRDSTFYMPVSNEYLSQNCPCESIKGAPLTLFVFAVKEDERGTVSRPLLL